MKKFIGLFIFVAILFYLNKNRYLLKNYHISVKIEYLPLYAK